MHYILNINQCPIVYIKNVLSEKKKVNAINSIKITRYQANTDSTIYRTNSRYY